MQKVTYTEANTAARCHRQLDQKLLNDMLKRLLFFFIYGSRLLTQEPVCRTCRVMRVGTETELADKMFTLDLNYK